MIAENFEKVKELVRCASILENIAEENESEVLFDKQGSWKMPVGLKHGFLDPEMYKKYYMIALVAVRNHIYRHMVETMREDALGLEDNVKREVEHILKGLAEINEQMNPRESAEAAESECHQPSNPETA